MWDSVRRGVSLRRLQSRSGSLQLSADRLEDLACALEQRYREAGRPLPSRFAGTYNAPQPGFLR